MKQRIVNHLSPSPPGTVHTHSQRSSSPLQPCVETLSQKSAYIAFFFFCCCFFQVFFSYSEITNVINLNMQDYSSRQVGTERGGATEVKSSSDVARCAGLKTKQTQSRKMEEKEKFPIYWPSVPLCIALLLYRDTLFTGSTGSAPDAPVRVKQILIKINTPL